MKRGLFLSIYYDFYSPLNTKMNYELSEYSIFASFWGSMPEKLSYALVLIGNAQSFISSFWLNCENSVYFAFFELWKLSFLWLSATQKLWKLSLFRIFWTMKTQFLG